MHILFTFFSSTSPGNDDILYVQRVYLFKPLASEESSWYMNSFVIIARYHASNANCGNGFPSHQKLTSSSSDDLERSIHQLLRTSSIFADWSKRLFYPVGFTSPCFLSRPFIGFASSSQSWKVSPPSLTPSLCGFRVSPSNEAKRDLFSSPHSTLCFD